MTPFQPGAVLAGKYRIERLLGEGGMGCVMLATHLQLDQQVALKFIHARHAESRPDAVARFFREARAAARIRSEHVARVMDVGVLEGGAPYLVMEYLEGQSLEGRIGKPPILLVPDIVDLAIQACEGLAEAHAAGVVHRDLKPANLFLVRKTDGSTCLKLLDFGISKLTPRASMPDDNVTNTRTLMGSPLYMSPEQLRSLKNVDRRTDMWSMGIILYELLGGRTPFVAETLPEICSLIMTEPPPLLHEIAPTLPEGLRAVILRCLEKDPERRFSDAGGLAQALAPFGGADAPAAAARVVRVVGAGGVPVSPDASVSVAKTAPTIGGTSAPFTPSAPGASRYPVGLAVAVAAAAILLGVTLAVGMMVRTRPSQESALAPAIVPPSSAMMPAPTTPATANPSAEAAVVRTAASSAISSASAVSSRPAKASVATAVSGKPRLTTTATPTGTTSFGGRD